MNRVERLAHILARAHRTAQPEDELEFRPHDKVRPPITEVDQRAKIYRDTDDLEDDEGEDLGEDRGEGSTLLFGGDEDDGLDGHHDEIGKDTLRKSRLKLLAGMVWAELGEADAVVEESAPNELSVRVQDLVWKVTVADDGKVLISGFDSGAEQFVGKIPDENAEAEIVKVSGHIHQLIAEDIDEKSTPVEPPVHFGPEDMEVGEEMGGEGEAPPVAPGGDEGVDPEETAIPPDLAAPPAPPQDTGGMPPMGAAPPAVPSAPGGMPTVPGQFPPATGGTPPVPGQFPTASRRQVTLPDQVRRVATARLETISNELENIGESLGEEGEEVFGTLADRVRSMMGWVD